MVSKPNINLKRFKPEGDKKFKERVVKEYITDDDDMDDVEQAYKGEFMEYLNQNLLLKYSGGNWEDWRNFTIVRDHQKEDELFQELGLKEGDEYL